MRIQSSWPPERRSHLPSALSPGFVQCDDYESYGSEVTLPDGTQRALVDPGIRLGCMMHVSRRFYGALQLGDKRAAHAVDWITQLYEIEAEAKERGLGPDQRLALRNERSSPVLANLEAWIDETKPKCTPKSPLAQAIGYAEQQRTLIRRCFTDGRFEIDNGHTYAPFAGPASGATTISSPAPFWVISGRQPAERDKLLLACECRNGDRVEWLERTRLSPRPPASCL